jgi:hypothetical protein
VERGLTSAGRELWQETVRVDTSVRRALRAGTTSEDRRRLDALLSLVNRNADSLMETLESGIATNLKVESR